MGRDIGQKTIGVAISDERGLAAHPLETIARQGTDRDVTTVLDLLASREAGAVVAGIPYELSGREGHRAKRVRVYLDALRQALPAGVELYEEDERFTTAAAQRVLQIGRASGRERG